MAVYDVSFLDRGMPAYTSMLFDEVEHSNGISPYSKVNIREDDTGTVLILEDDDFKEQRGGDIEYIPSSRTKKENIDPERDLDGMLDEGPRSGYPSERMHVLLNSRSDSLYSYEEGPESPDHFMDRPYYHSGKFNRNSEAIDTFYSKFCKNGEVSLPQTSEHIIHEDRYECSSRKSSLVDLSFESSHDNESKEGLVNGGKDDLHVIEVCVPETSGECVQLVLKNNLKQKQIQKVLNREINEVLDDRPRSEPQCPEVLEGSKAEQFPFDQLADKKVDYRMYDSQCDGDELIYVEESHPVLPGAFDNIPLKFTSDGDKCTLGEVAEKVLEINVDDPFDLCSLLAAEKQAGMQEQGKRRRRKMLHNNLSSEKLRKVNLSNTMLPKSKDLRVSKLKVFNYPYKCSRCDSWFVDSCDLKVHMSTHKEKSFKSVKDFIHEKIFKKQEIDQVVINAPIYFKSVDSNENIRMQSPLEDDVNTVSCSLCNMQFKNNANLSIHMQIHNQEKDLPSTKTKVGSTPNPFKCGSCTASFGTSFNLKRHTRIHTGTRPYKCEECHSAFITKAQLTTHMRTHTGEKPYMCNICGGKFIQQNNLKRHIMTHTGEKPFKCDKCSAAFISSSDLKRHIRVHTGEKPYKCTHCNKGFTTSGNLSSHHKMHTGEKPYKCHLCEASFSHQSNLKTHIKRHIDRLPFKCGCGGMWSQKASLLKHMRKCKHANDVSAIDFGDCEDGSFDSIDM